MKRRAHGFSPSPEAPGLAGCPPARRGQRGTHSSCSPKPSAEGWSPHAAGAAVAGGRGCGRERAAVASSLLGWASAPGCCGLCHGGAADVGGASMARRAAAVWPMELVHTRRLTARSQGSAMALLPGSHLELARTLGAAPAGGCAGSACHPFTRRAARAPCPVSEGFGAVWRRLLYGGGCVDDVDWRSQFSPVSSRSNHIGPLMTTTGHVGRCAHRPVHLFHAIHPREATATEAGLCSPMHLDVIRGDRCLVSLHHLGTLSWWRPESGKSAVLAVSPARRSGLSACDSVK